MRLPSRLLTALIVVALAGPALAAAPDAPFRLRCEIDFGNPAPVVQFYRLDPVAGEVRREPGALYTRDGVADDGEALAAFRVIETWTDRELILRSEVRSKSGPQTSTARDILNLRTLKLRIEVATRMSTFTLSPSTYEGRCKRAPLDAPST